MTIVGPKFVLFLPICFDDPPRGTTLTESLGFKTKSGLDIKIILYIYLIIYVFIATEIYMHIHVLKGKRSGRKWQALPRSCCSWPWLQ